MATVKELILDVLELQAELGGLENSVKEVSQKIGQAALSHNEAIKKQVEASLAQEEAIRLVKATTENAAAAEKYLAEVEQRFKNASAEQDAALVKERAFDDALFASLKAVIDDAAGVVVKAEEERNSLLAKVGSKRKQIETKQKELKELGYEFNLGTPKASKTTAI